MVELLIGILLAISTHSACDLGKPVDWYSWANAHPEAEIVASFKIPDDTDYWLMTDDTDYYLFVFAKPIAETIGSGQDHGKCFRDVGKVS